MKPWELLDSTPAPGGAGTLRLYRRGDEYAIKIDNVLLMSSRSVHSERALAELGCRTVADRKRPAVLVGGLGMGFTLAAALEALPATAEVVVAELVPAVIAWNRTHLADLAGQPLEDDRVTVFQGDIAKLLRSGRSAYDALLLDVDNGPESLTQAENDWLYAAPGLQAISRALRPGGVLAVWSEGEVPPFSRRLRQAGFRVEESSPRSSAHGRGVRHKVWLATRKE